MFFKPEEMEKLSGRCVLSNKKYCIENIEDKARRENVNTMAIRKKNADMYQLQTRGAGRAQ